MSFGAEQLWGRRRPLKVQHRLTLDHTSTISTSSNKTWSSQTIGAWAGNPGRKIFAAVFFNSDASKGNNWYNREVSLSIGGQTADDATDPVGTFNRHWLNNHQGGHRELVAFFEFDGISLGNTEDVVLATGGYEIYYARIVIIEVLNGPYVTGDQDADGSNAAPAGSSVTLSNKTTDVILSALLSRHDSSSNPTYSGHGTLVASGSLVSGSGTFMHYAVGINSSPSANQTVSVTPFASSRSAVVSIVLRRG